MKKSVKIFVTSLAGAATLALAFGTALACSVHSLRQKTGTAPSPSAREIEKLEIRLNEKYPERLLHATSLPYEIPFEQPEVNCESAVVIDTVTGNILFEKNPNKPIPPASMTKLVEMFVVFEECRNSNITLDDIVPLPPESWSVNLPSDASRMFLGKNQKVTLRELLLGLSIASGNDASIAVAKYISGDMDSFVARMNSVVKNLGLKKTHFVESSGYSENNITTAREFAAFSRVYINRFPFSLKDFHSKRELRYPQKKNLLPDARLEDNPEIVQKNTNKLLGKLEGCDGLKTGFIYESGYNLALTATRDSRRFLSVTMGGPGNNTAEGNKYRVIDGTALMEYCFANFDDYIVPESERHAYKIGVAGAAESECILVPAFDEKLTVPKSMKNKINAKAHIPSFILGKRNMGHQIGFLEYEADGITLRKVPLVCLTDIQEGSVLEKLWGKLVYKVALKLEEKNK